MISPVGRSARNPCCMKSKHTITCWCPERHPFHSRNKSRVSKQQTWGDLGQEPEPNLQYNRSQISCTTPKYIYSLSGDCGGGSEGKNSANESTIQREGDKKCMQLCSCSQLSLFVAEWKDCEELKPKRKEKWIFVIRKGRMRNIERSGGLRPQVSMYEMWKRQKLHENGRKTPFEKLFRPLSEGWFS